MTSVGGRGDLAAEAPHGRPKLRAPREDRGVLIDPAWSELPALVAANQARRAAWSFELAGEPIARFAAAAREQLLRDAHAYTSAYRDVALPASIGGSTRVLLAGHQPELFHPGVWAKNFALDALAGGTLSIGVNILIDGDTLKSPSLRVPSGSLAQPLVEAIPFDLACEEIPYEERGVQDAALFGSFGDRATAAIQPLLAESQSGPPLLGSFWPDVVAQAAATRRIGAAFARARHRLEGSWGLNTLELPQSALCDSPHFRRFVGHLAGDLARFVAIHNAELAAYRRREGIRSANHPVPELAADGEWLEAPFWIWSADAPRRRHAFARSVGGEVELTDRADVTLRFRPAAAVDALEAAARRGVKLRSRALMTTMYARLVLGDLFLHGIGGGKYDELTDAVARRYFGVEPPAFAVVTATRRLPLGRSSAKSTPAPHERIGDHTAEHIDEPAARHRLWELQYHAERFLDLAALAPAAAEQARSAIAAKAHWSAVEPTRENGKTRCHALREANAALAPLIEPQLRKWREIHAQTKVEARTSELLGSREYSAWLFPEQDLRNFLLDIGRH